MKTEVFYYKSDMHVRPVRSKAQPGGG